MKAFLYVDKRSLNEATLYYVNLVEECLKEIGYEIRCVYKLNDIKSPDLIFTITSFNYVKGFLRYPFVKTLTWRQGLVYQESLMTRSWWKRILQGLTEYITVKTADMLMFVSDCMRDYYSRSPFGYNKSNYVIMPCYNLRLSEFFDLKKYNKPTFVYAGGVSKWQSVDTILDTYAEVEHEIPNAKLFLYCKDNETLRNEISKRGIKNYEIKFVSVDQLQGELLQYKYGFILREKNWVNEVATPTKMNSYLAAYLIPIYSDGVDDFKRNIRLGDFRIMAETPLNAKVIANQIVEFERSSHDYNLYKSIVKENFERHYNDNVYKPLIKEALCKYVLKK